MEFTDSVRSILDDKGSNVYCITPSHTVYDALEQMSRLSIGALMVLDDEKIVGIISERDYARKIILKGKASKDTLVREIMSEKLSCVTLSQTVQECMALMTERHVRHLPVIDGQDKVLGILSIGDLVKETISDQKFTIEQLVHYIQN